MHILIVQRNNLDFRTMCFIQIDINICIIYDRYVISALLTSLAVCKEGIVHYYEGDMWNVSNCKFCICHNGQKSCSFAQCAKIKCGEVNTKQKFDIVMYQMVYYLEYKKVSMQLV